MDYHPIVSKIKEVLDRNNLWYESFEHIAVTTSLDAAKVRSGYSLNQGAKALIIRVKNNNQDRKFVMIVLPGDLKFNNDKVKEILSAKDMRFATPEEIDIVTGGVQIGGVPPFGNLFGMEVYADKKLFDNKIIIFNAGDRRYSLAIKSVDYKKLVNPKEVDIT